MNVVGMLPEHSANQGSRKVGYYEHRKLQSWALWEHAFSIAACHQLFETPPLSHPRTRVCVMCAHQHCLVTWYPHVLTMPRY